MSGVLIRGSQTVPRIRLVRVSGRRPRSGHRRAAQQAQTLALHIHVADVLRPLRIASLRPLSSGSQMLWYNSIAYQINL